MKLALRIGCVISHGNCRVENSSGLGWLERLPYHLKYCLLMSQLETSNKRVVGRSPTCCSISGVTRELLWFWLHMTRRWRLGVIASAACLMVG